MRQWQTSNPMPTTLSDQTFTRLVPAKQYDHLARKEIKCCGASFTITLLKGDFCPAIITFRAGTGKGHNPLLVAKTYKDKIEATRMYEKLGEYKNYDWPDEIIKELTG